MIRLSSRDRVRSRRNGRSSVTPEQEVLSAALTADQVDLKAHLHQQAAQSVSMTLTRMQQRTRKASQMTPELAPFLAAYFEAAGSSLLQNTIEILNDHDQSCQPPVHAVSQARRSAWPFWPRSIRRLIPVRSREEQPDGAA